MAVKLSIIILVSLGIVGFGASYFMSGWLRPQSAPAGQVEGDPGQADGDSGQADAQETDIAAPPVFAQPISISMKERELDDLIKELRFKIDASRKKEEEIGWREPEEAGARVGIDQNKIDRTGRPDRQRPGSKGSTGKCPHSHRARRADQCPEAC